MIEMLQTPNHLCDPLEKDSSFILILRSSELDRTRKHESAPRSEAAAGTHAQHSPTQASARTDRQPDGRAHTHAAPRTAAHVRAHTPAAGEAPAPRSRSRPSATTPRQQEQGEAGHRGSQLPPSVTHFRPAVDFVVAQLSITVSDEIVHAVHEEPNGLAARLLALHPGDLVAANVLGRVALLADELPVGEAAGVVESPHLLGHQPAQLLAEEVVHHADAVLVHAGHDVLQRQPLRHQRLGLPVGAQRGPTGPRLHAARVQARLVPVQQHCIPGGRRGLGRGRCLRLTAGSCGGGGDVIVGQRGGLGGGLRGRRRCALPDPRPTAAAR